MIVCKRSLRCWGDLVQVKHRAWIAPLHTMVPSLEHNNEVKGESLDLIKYIDNNFEGPSLFPDDPSKKEFGEELLSYTDSCLEKYMLLVLGGLEGWFYELQLQGMIWMW